MAFLSSLLAAALINGPTCDVWVLQKLNETTGWELVYRSPSEGTLKRLEASASAADANGKFRIKGPMKVLPENGECQ